MRQVVHLSLLLALVCAAALPQDKPPAGVASTPPDVQRGQLAPSVHCAVKPEQSYALYLPSNYTPERRWPIVYVFEPLARGTLPVGLMKAAAERYGYLVAGSNNSRNGPWKPELEAATTMWDDTHARFSIDDRRVYFAGHSGGAREAAQLAQLCKCVHGVFLNGAGFGVKLPPSRDAVFAVFGAIGIADFNHGEMAELDAKLDTLGFPHFLRRFDDRHVWAPAEVWEEAFAWMALLAMKDGRQTRDDAFIAGEFQRATERARKLEDTGDVYFAWGKYRELAATFDGLADTSTFKERIAALENTPAVRAGAKQEKTETEEQRRIEGDILAITDRLQEAGGDRTSLRLDAATRLRRLREDALKEKRPETRRVLERARDGLFVVLLETAGPLLDSGKYDLAEPYFELASQARPDSTWPYLALARCRASMGDKKQALRELKRAREAGVSSSELAQFVKTNPKLAPLADDPKYQELIADAPANGAVHQ